MVTSRKLRPEDICVHCGSRIRSEGGGVWIHYKPELYGTVCRGKPADWALRVWDTREIVWSNTITS